MKIVEHDRLQINKPFIELLHMAFCDEGDHAASMFLKGFTQGVRLMMNVHRGLLGDFECAESEEGE